MFSRKKKTPPAKSSAQPETARPTNRKGSGIPSIISSDLRVLGNIVSQGVVDIDGIIEGNVKCHTATIRKNGHIKGDVIAESVQVYGTIQGLIKARSVHFFRGCRAEGVIMHESITIEDGAFVDGRFKRTENLDLEENSAESTAKTLGTESPAFDASGFKAPSFMSNTEEESGNSAESTDKKPAKAKKQESALDNLRLISDVS
jgi:cytoskeletal protein CcmA (bactofilin family)